MTRTLVFGAGKVGSTIAHLLHHSGDYAVTLADKDDAALERAASRLPVQTVTLDASDHSSLVAAFKGVDQVVSAGPFYVNTNLAVAALEAGVSYFDLTEDRETTATIRGLSDNARAGQVFMPQCGLAPGFIGILAAHLSADFERLHEVKMRVGALPKYPTNKLLYNLTWSTDGVINEYINRCEAVHDGKVVELEALEGLETFSLDGITYEAFNTSGGLGTLCETLSGKINCLDYKSVRYPGHRDLMQFLLQDLRLAERRELLKDILENALPITMQDVVLVFCTASGYRDGRFEVVTDTRKVYDRVVHGERLSAIQLTTAASLCAVLDLHAQGVLPDRGFVRQEDVPFEPFLANRFGRYYQT
jgi:saccharopine dehydrogenase-like NADP-dependent oxidoreductase